MRTETTFLPSAEKTVIREQNLVAVASSGETADDSLVLVNAIMVKNNMGYGRDFNDKDGRSTLCRLGSHKKCKGHYFKEHHYTSCKCDCHQEKK